MALFVDLVALSNGLHGSVQMDSVALFSWIGWIRHRGILKNEIYYGYEKEYRSFSEFSEAIRKYIEYYNNERIQAKTKWMPPVKYREASMMSA